VRHPENVACSPNGREMVLFDGNLMHMIEMLLVIEIVPKSEPSSAKRKAGGK
jgi:hypothetical protein